MNKKNIGQNLGVLRRQSGMTQAELAEETGVTTDHISHVEIGSGTISLPLLLNICNLLDVTPNDILAGEYGLDVAGEMGSQGEIPSLCEFSWNEINPSDRILLNYLYQFMANRKREPQMEEEG